MDSKYFAFEARKKKAILDRRSEFPSFVQDAIGEHEDDTTYEFLHYLQGTIRNNFDDWFGQDPDTYKVPTRAQVDVFFRFFPDSLSIGDFFDKRIPLECHMNKRIERDQWGHPVRAVYDINLDTLHLVPLLAKLGIELNQFSEEERGGLLCKHGCDGMKCRCGWNRFGLRELITYVEEDDYDSGKDYHEAIDIAILDVMKDLRKMGLFQKDDIQKYDLVNEIINTNRNGIDFPSNFPIRRLLYMIHWDPECLKKSRHYSNLVQDSAEHDYWNLFLLPKMLDAGMRYYPNEIGFYFHKHPGDSTDTAFAMTRKRHGKNKDLASKLIRMHLNKAVQNDENFTLNAVLNAASEEKIALDGLYTLIRMDPSVISYATIAVDRRK